MDRLALFAGRPVASWLLGIWAAAEAIALPIVPDVGLCLLALAAPSATPRLFIAVMVGAVVGSLGMAALTSADPEGIRAMLLTLPGIDQAVLADVDRAIAEQGLAAFAQIGPGPPVKAYTASWIGNGGDLAGLLLAVVVNRITRIAPVVLAAAVAGVAARSLLRTNDRLAVVAYFIAWAAFYAIYLT